MLGRVRTFRVFRAFRVFRVFRVSRVSRVFRAFFQELPIQKFGFWKYSGGAETLQGRKRWTSIFLSTGGTHEDRCAPMRQP